MPILPPLQRRAAEASVLAATLVFSFPGCGEAQNRPIPLDTLRVTGSRVSADLPLRTRAVQVISRGELDRIPARTVSQVLSWALGAELGMRSPAQADLSLRGSGFEQVLVLVDGVRMSDPQTGHFDLDLTVPMDRIERIEILRGPASAVYGGDAVGGVVNVITRESRDWSVRVEGGSWGSVVTGLQGGAPTPGGGTVSLSGEWNRSDGHRAGIDHEIFQGRLDLSLPLADGRFKFEVGEGKRDFGADDFYAPYPSFETTRTRTASARWSNAPGSRIRVEPGISWRSHDDDFILVRADPSIYRNQHTSSQMTGEVVVRGDWGETLGWAAGAEVGRDALESNALGDRDEDRSALFGEVLIGDTGPIVLSAGLRLDRHARWGSFVSPSLSAAFTASPSTRFRASFGRAFRGPTWTERHYVDPAHRAREDLEPERSSAIEAGVEVTPSRSLTLSASLFRRVSEDLIDWARPSVPGGEGLWETRNVTRAEFRGVEGEARFEIGDRNQLTFGASFLSVDAEDAAEFESKYALRPLADHFLIGWSSRLPGGLEASVRALQGRRVEEETFRQLDLRLSLPVMDGTLYLDGVNLGNADHPDITGNPVAGRAFFVGYRMGSRR